MGIYDGHGGVYCADYLSNNLSNMVIIIYLM
jgi:serine/threonine protein phosphatase PrpC